MKSNQIKSALFLLLLLAATLAHAAHPLDSTGIELKDGKCFIKHKVDANETIYAIARKYKVLAKTLQTVNPETKQGLKVGDIILIPCIAQTSKAKSSNLTENIVSDIIKPADKLKEEKSSLQLDGKETEARKVVKYHIVTKGQTLYSVAKLNNVSVADLKKWNNIGKEGLKVGSKILVTKEDITEILSQETQLKEDKKPDLRPSKTIEKNNSGYDKIVETGLAELFETTDGLSKHLALHRNAPAGTIIKLKNTENGSMVFVKVVGKLPEDTDSRVIIKVSKMAMDRVDAEKNFFKAEISYIPVN